MLYLVRGLDKSIIINDDIIIKVVEIKKNTVKLGITFPPGTSVLREELYHKIVEENKKAQTQDFDEV